MTFLFVWILIICYLGLSAWYLYQDPYLAGEFGRSNLRVLPLLPAMVFFVVILLVAIVVLGLMLRVFWEP